MANHENNHMIDITDDPDIWSRCYSVHSLVVVGSTEEDGNYNFAPKHMAMPLGFGPYFGFMGTPRKMTYRNIKREQAFTVSYPKPEQVVISSLTASRREEDNTLPIIENIPTTEAQKISGKFIANSYFQLECKLHEIMGKFGEWEIVVGEVVAAYVQEGTIREQGDDANPDELLQQNPILAYLHPDRFSVINESNAFPFPKDFKR